MSAAPNLPEGNLSGSVYGLLAEQCGTPLSYCSQTIEAAMPTDEECKIFDLAEPIPCLLIKRRSYTHGDVMIEYVEGLFRGDAYSYRLNLRA